MMRLKIILPNLFVILAVGLGGWLYLRSYYTGHFDRSAEDRIRVDRALFEDVNQLNAVKFLRTVVARSSKREVRNIFSQVTAEELARFRGGAAPTAEGEEAPAPTDGELRLILRLRAHRECQAVRTYMGLDQMGGRTPELVAVTDSNGMVVSRDVDPNAEPVGEPFGERYASIRRALEGSAVRDILFWNDYLLDVAIAPIIVNGSAVGTLLVGYDISNGVAQSNQEMFRTDIAYLIQQDNQWRVHSSSIAVGARRNSLISAMAGQQEVLTASMSPEADLQFMRVTVEGEDHVALAGSLSRGRASTVPAGYVMLMSVQNIRAPAAKSIMALLFALGGALVVVIIGFILSWHFLKPVEEIEEGVLRIINGDIEHRFEVHSSEFGGLAYRVNQLVAALTGEEEESEQDQSSGGPQG